MTDLPLHETHSDIHDKELKSLQALRRCLSTAWLILKDFRNGLLGAGVSVGKAYEMIYVEPYQGKNREEHTDPRRW